MEKDCIIVGKERNVPRTVDCVLAASNKGDFIIPGRGFFALLSTITPAVGRRIKLNIEHKLGLKWYIIALENRRRPSINGFLIIQTRKHNRLPSQEIISRILSFDVSVH